MNCFFKKMLALLMLLAASFSLNAQIRFHEFSFEDLVKKSLEENKPVFLFLSNNNNECWWMEHNVFNNTVIGEFYNENFVCGIFFGQINYSNLSTEKLKIKNYPYILYYDPKTGTAYSAEGGKTEEQILQYGKIVTNEIKLLSVMNHQVNDLNPDGKSTTYKISDNDGRYTLGVKGKRLMYGYPYPNSTSHFVINADGEMASNSPRFLISRDMDITDYLEKKGFLVRIFSIFKRKKKKRIRIKSYPDVSYLSDTLMISFDKSNSMHSKIKYRFNGLDITQKLSPLNEGLEPSKEGDSTRYYQVDYIIKNNSNKVINLGLLVLFDMMIDDNDAAKMDAFKTDLLEFVTPDIKRNNGRLRGKYAKHLKNEQIKRILVYHNKTLTKSLTGDFRLVTEPDEIHIGSWPVFFSVLWDMPKIKKGEKYFDSAVILKWLKNPLAPGDTYYYTTIFGLYNKGVLELIPAGTNYTGTNKDGERVKPIKPEFKAEPDTIYEGEMAALTWQVENPMNADIYISAKPKARQRNQGRITVKPKSTTSYYLQMLQDGKEIAVAQAKVVVLKRPQKVSLDGRYTVGNENNPITFGYPFPYSTSFFQLYYKKKYYSNNNNLPKSKYLEGKQFENLPEDKRNEVSYETKDFEIIQRLVPLENELHKTVIDSAVFFRCEYVVKNNTKNEASYSLRQILDFSFLTSDNIQLKLDNRRNRFNQTFLAKVLPKKVFIGDEESEEGIILNTTISKFAKPVSVSVGDWHFLKNLEIKTRYSDSSFYKSPAVLIRWKKNVMANDSVKFAFILGSAKKENLKYQYNQALEIKSLTINFETKKHVVSKEQQEKILDFIKQYQFDFIVLEGFTDNRGTLEKNYQLAKSRVEHTEAFLINNGKIEVDKIINKIHGEFFSNQKAKNKEVDDKEERKVKIVLFKKQVTN